MMLLQEISERTTLSDANSMAVALKDLKKVPEHEIHFYLVQRDTLGVTSANTRQTITLAQLEYDRRKTEETRTLAQSTTRWAAGIGAIAAIIGAGFGAWLTYWLKG